MIQSPIAASVLMPTFGEARFARLAIESVRRQTINNIEIFIICDGSSPQMISFFKDLAAEDSRIRLYYFEKSERTGEPYRDMIIKKEALGRNIFYCSHDDLWFPNHIEELNKLLRYKSFVHSLHFSIKEDKFREDTFIRCINYADLAIDKYRERMQNTAKPKNYFGLTFSAHTRKAYLELKEGWATTPPGISTDLHMWRKFLARFPSDCATCKNITAVSFPAVHRRGWSEEKRENEMVYYFNRMQETDFIANMNEIALYYKRNRLLRFLNRYYNRYVRGDR